MALREPALDSPFGKQEGWLGEHEVDRELVLGSRWRLLPYLPLFDTRHVDRAYAWDGIGRPQFVQVKTAFGPRSDGIFGWRIYAETFQAYRNFSVVLSGADRDTGRVLWSWCIDSRLVGRLGKLAFIVKSGRHEYLLRASISKQDHLARYRYRPEDLWRHFAPAPTQTMAPGFPRMAPDEGAYFEYAFVANFLAQGKDQLQCYQPAVDVAGRDMLVQLANTWRAIYVQIKGIAKVQSRRILVARVNRASFTAADDFWLAFYYYDRSRPGMFEDCWLVPSRDFVDMTASHTSPEVMTFSANLDPERDRWRAFRHPIGQQARVLRAALAGLRW